MLRAAASVDIFAESRRSGGQPSEREREGEGKPGGKINWRRAAVRLKERESGSKENERDRAGGERYFPEEFPLLRSNYEALSPRRSQMFCAAVK